MRKLLFSKAAQHTLDRMPVNTAGLIRAKLGRYVANPSEFANSVRSLKGAEGLLRMRIGDWRVLFTDTGTVVSILKIAPRGSAYR